MELSEVRCKPANTDRTERLATNGGTRSTDAETGSVSFDDATVSGLVRGLPRPSPQMFAEFSGLGEVPHLIVIVDTEEEFDWSKPLSRENTAVTAVASQHRIQDIFVRYGVIPTYVVDYPVAAKEESVSVLKAFLNAGLCVIGAHLHPWVNPPHTENVTSLNSYPGNLDAALEAEKLAILTETIATNFDMKPTVYRAGRFGVGPNTPAILSSLGYKMDVSVVPFTSFHADGGPDFSAFDWRPFWTGDSPSILEVPATAGFVGRLADLGPDIYPRLFQTILKGFRAPGLCARLRLLERIRLTPEGVDFHGLRRLTTSLYRRGCRIFSLTYHSPSLSPGHTPYVRDDEDLKTFLATVDQYCRWFIQDLGGRPATPIDLYDVVRESDRENFSGRTRNLRVEK